MMRLLLSIEHAVLSSAMRVTVVDNPVNSVSEKPTVTEHYVKQDDPEWRLLAQAIDRFTTVQKLKDDAKTTELDALEAETEEKTKAGQQH